MAKVMVFDHNSQKVSLEKRQKKQRFLAAEKMASLTCLVISDVSFFSHYDSVHIDY